MSTLNQLTYDLLGVLESGGKSISDDSSTTLRQLAWFIKNSRAQLIRQQMSRGQSLSDNIVQTLSCLPVLQVDATTCCDLNSDCYIVRTTTRIPTPVEGYQRDLIERVAPQMVGARAYPLIPYTRASVWGSSRWNKDKPAAFIHDGYIYIMNSDFVTQITVDGVFDDPTELANFATCSGNPCYSKDDKYPISGHMIDTMKKMIMDTNFRFLMQNATDTHNDASSAVSKNVDSN